MQKLMALKKIFPIVLLALALAVAAFALRFAPTSHSAVAEGNLAGDGENAIALILDLNGKDATIDDSLSDTANITNNQDKDNWTTTITANSGKHIRVRNLLSSVVAAEKKLDSPQSWNFATDSVYNSSTAFSVSVNRSTGGRSMTVTALAVTPEGYPGRFSVALINGNQSVTVYFTVQVQDTFVQLDSTDGSGAYGWTDISTGDHSVLVGDTYADKNGEVGAVAGNNHSPLLTINNNSTVTIDFSQYVLGRALYCKPLSTTGAAASQYSVLMKQGQTDKCWGLSSVSNFAISGVAQLSGADGVFSHITYVNPDSSTRIAPRVVFDVAVTTSIINQYRGPNDDYNTLSSSERIERFWSDTHYINISFVRLGGTTEYHVVIPVRFLPSNPQIISQDSSVFSLNMLSPYTYELSTGKYYRDGQEVNIQTDSSFSATAGYKSIIVRASDLIEYSFPSSYGSIPLCFNVTDSKTTANYSIDPYESENTPIINDVRCTAVLLTALNSGNFTLNFNIEFYTAPGSSDSRAVALSISGFGKYSVTIPNIAGKKAVSYNVLSDDSPFVALLSDGYQLTGVSYLDGEDYYSYQFLNNVLTITPNIDNINGQANSNRLRLTFADTAGHEITVDTEPFNIDVKAGSFKNQFEDWEQGLIIGGACLGGIIIILLIVWIFIHSISKHRQEENATAAPVSSYIVKLNSTIAQQQAQARAASNQVLSQASGQMLLGAGPTSTQAPPPDTLQLGTGTGVASTPGSEPSYSTPGGIPSTNEPVTDDLNALIAQYITDEELLERIFTEKYEPKGMVRRTFFKSKDTQARELEKEKKRIIARYKTPMPMDEAIMSESEIRAAEGQNAAPTEQPQEAEVPVFELDFDPDSPLYTPTEQSNDEFGEERIDIDVSPEEAAYNDAARKYEILEKELAELAARLDKVQSQLDKHTSLADELREKIGRAEADDEQLAKDVEELEFKLASAKNKEKDKIQRDLKIKEEKKARNLDELARLRAELDALLGGGQKLYDAKSKLDSLKVVKDAEKEDLTAELEKTQAALEAYKQRLAQVKARQELEAKIESLSPLLVDVDHLDFDIKQLEDEIKRCEKEREDVKSDVAAAKSQILGANDFDVINELNTRIADDNARLADIEKELTKATKRKSELTIEFNAARRKANDYIEKNEIPLEDVIAAEDVVIGNIELDKLKAERGVDRDEAEQRVAQAQAVFDDMSASSADVTMVAMEIAANIKDIEDELADTQAELDNINAQMETASEDEKLMLMVDQGDKTDKIEELKERLNQANVEGTKRKMEAQSEYDGKLEEAHKALDEANAEYQAACAKYDALIDNTNPLDLIVSGSGVISQDQKKIEAENLKKQLEKQKAEAEQARLAAQQAQQEAEQARIDAMRASDEAKAEAERKAQEAIEAAEAARREAEESAERARIEAEEAAETARREAEEAAENARREAEEAAENARREAEESAERARIEAEEAAERARIEAEEAAERAKREAEESALAEAEEAKRKAQEEIDEMRRKAEEDAEKARLDEETKRREEEERQKADAERKDAIAKKVALRKEKIINIRDRMKDIKGEEDAKALREQLYTMQLGFDEDERGSTELMDFYNKTMDDIQHAGEIATLKAENAKKPQRVVRKVTERVNRIPRKKARPNGARPAGARPRPNGARPAGSARPRPNGARPAGARPRPNGARPARPAGTRPSTSGKRPTPPRRPQ